MKNLRRISAVRYYGYLYYYYYYYSVPVGIRNTPLPSPARRVFRQINQKQILKFIQRARPTRALKNENRIADAVVIVYYFAM